MARTTLVYDDDCGFCTWWAEYFDDRTDVRIVGFSDLTPELRERLPEEYEACSHFLTETDVYSCGASIEQVLAHSGIVDPLDDVVGFARNFEDYERLREHGYRWAANNRDLLGRVVSTTPPARRESNDS
ncbi:DCC1-like thiol-disulfide oxidoreductase family protein [Natrarchaeobius sp. A-rgal3]|uniref:DCC1-like thiol-disulfide oxidoreductase family protein n=1 Tax=Natrarchaeobius versutus TaxID=1679078 RepID=UPI00350F6665